LPSRNSIAAAIFAGVVSICASVAAFAQPAPSPSPAAKPPAPAGSPAPSPAASASAAPSPTATPYKLITLNGYGDGGFTSIQGSDTARFVTGTPSRVFDASTGPFFDENGGRQLAPANDFSNALDLQNANIKMTLNGPFIGGVIEESFGTDADVMASNGQSRSGNNLTQAYLQAVRGPVTLLAGKFETLAGAEVIESPNDYNYSRSYGFGYAIPFTHTGVRLTYAVNPKVSLVVGGNNGWDDWKFAGKKKTLEGAILLTPTPGYAVTLDTYNGNDFALTGNSSIGALPVYTNRMLYDGVLTVHPTSALTLVANYDNGTQLADGTGAFATAHWNELAGYLDYQFTPVYGLAFREETFGDPNGFRTTLAQRVQSSTATLQYSPGTNFIFRAEYRIDSSDVNAFSYRGYNAATDLGRPHQESIGVETIVKFP
jgi:hypothetical protein